MPKFSKGWIRAELSAWWNGYFHNLGIMGFNLSRVYSHNSSFVGSEYMPLSMVFPSPETGMFFDVLGVFQPSHLYANLLCCFFNYLVFVTFLLPLNLL